MKAEFRAPTSKDRKPLIELLPLKTPLTMYIDPSSICNFACKFCFQANKKIKRQMQLQLMTMDIFNMIVEQLGDFEDSIKMVHLHGFGEPLLNKNFYKMVKILRDSKLVDRIATTTNVSLLTKENTHKIIESGLNQVHFSIYGLSDDNYLTFSGKKTSFKHILDNIKYFYANKKNCHIHIKINGDYYSNADKERFLDIFGDYCDSIFIDGVANIWPLMDVAETLSINLSKEQKETTKLQHQYKHIKPQKDNLCPNIFYQLMIHSNGDISPCCADYLGKIKLGNIKTHNLKNIWGGGNRVWS
ncbi:hypothetical protein CCY99_09060 [Helicobacter sp. 16-1353]|uniref:radical SAM/SPASM domain-containing protein n=1 Tax=Helicobacter sp. 16-1353 TaxID=2004996 RepID=UPI000DCB826C|nr:radical SAM protein [Helicobacter sp. 16-1353]RAX51420.1 hypothetical protein CCY99_09060 [Helicobacter sp. 16-1353]